MRAFIAVEMSGPVRAELARTIESLSRAAGSVKWVEPRNIHLTLKFLGSVADGRIPELAARARECCARATPCDLELKGAGAFPNLGRPRVIFAEGADRPPTLAALAEELNGAMEEFGVEREERGFRCHITLGRVRVPRPAPELAERLRGLADRLFGRMRIEEAVLMKSDLTPRGPIYTPVERFRLGEANQP
jgi:2'-5' RNA ligase